MAANLRGGQLEARAAGAVEEGVGLVVTEELFGGGVPVEFAAKLAGDVEEVAYRDGAVADFDVGVGSILDSLVGGVLDEVGRIGGEGSLAEQSGRAGWALPKTQQGLRWIAFTRVERPRRCPVSGH